PSPTPTPTPSPTPTPTPTPSPTPSPSPSGTCDRSATTSTFAAHLSAPPPGRMICLAPCSYGSFAGSNKSGTVTIAEQVGATASISLNFTAPSNIVVDGLTINGSAFSGSTKNVTV